MQMLTNIHLMNRFFSPHKTIAPSSTPEKLFDLCLVEEMGDEEYTVEILQLFLRHTPPGLLELEDTCTVENFEDAYKIAHKLKSSVGLLHANGLLRVLTHIEEGTRSGSKNVLAALARQAIVEFKKIEFPLQQKLNRVLARPGILI